MKRVLVTGAANIGKAGVATIVYKWGQHFDSNVIIYDYLMQRGLPEEKYVKAIAEKGGIIYTIGGVIYALKLKVFNANHKYFGSHEIFHLFVMAGSICHFIMMFNYVAVMPLK